MKVTKRALEVMRERNNPPGGHIQQVTSIGGQIGMSLFHFGHLNAASSANMHHRCTVFLDLLRIEARDRRLYGSHQQGGEARVEHYVHVH